MAVDIAIARPELLQVAEAVAREKMIEREEVLEAMEQAIQKAGRAKYGLEKDIRATIDRQTLVDLGHPQTSTIITYNVQSIQLHTYQRYYDTLR